MQSFQKLALALAAAGFMGSALAGPPTNVPVSPTFKGGISPEATISTRARVAVLYRNGFGVIKSKGVASVTTVQPGVHCVTPSPSLTLNLAGTYPTVNVEWGWSSGSSLIAYTFDNVNFAGFFACAATDFVVMTFDTTGGVPTLADNVAFTLTIN